MAMPPSSYLPSGTFAATTTKKPAVSTRQGEVTTIVQTSRRILIGALLAPYTEVFEEFARTNKKSHQQLYEVMITKHQLFELLRRGMCTHSLGDSIVADTTSQLLANNNSLLSNSHQSPTTGIKHGQIELKAYDDTTILDDLEFIWSEITILLSDGDDDGAGRMQRLKSKKFQSFKAGAKSTNVAAPPPLLNVDDVQRTATLPGNLVDGQNSAVLVAEEGELVESDHDSDELAAMGTVELPHNSKIREDVAMNVIIKNRLAAAGVNACNEVSVKDLILRLSVASSPSPTITEDEAARIVSLLSETYRSNEEITRNAFMLLLKQHADEPELQNVEMEELVLYLFPDDVNAVGCLRQLIHRCQVSSNHHGFSVKYAEQRLQDWGDAKELFFYVPFLALYLCLVVSGKFIAPRSYYGYGASVAVSNTLYAPTFTSCSYDAQSVSQCNDTKSVTATTLAGRTDWYYYMQQVFVPALWVASSPSSTAAETILGNDLRLVGAVKIRNIRVIGSEDLSDAEKYFGPKNATYSKTYPGYSRSNTDKSEHPNYFLNNTVFPTNSVLPGFDGLHYKTCSELNASGSVLGNLDSFSCDGHGLVIPLNTTNSQVLAIIATLASTEWIDRQTRAVVAEILLFHPESTMLIRSQLLVEFQPGGGLTTTTTIHPFTFATFSSVDFVFNTLYILFFVLLFLNIIRYVVWNFLRPLFIGGPSRDFLRFRNHMVLDFLNYAMFVVSAISRLIWMNIGSPTDPVWLTTYYPNGFEDAATYYNTFVIIDGFNVMLCVLGLLRFGKFIPAMGIVVKALVNSSKDAGALLFVIIGTFLSLVVCAASVFGDSVLGYHSVLWAAETLGQAFIGNYDYTPLHDAHPTFAFVFFFVFQLTITVILLNMFIAVFTDAFNAAMESSFDRVTSTHILDNTAQHPFVRSNAWSLALGSMPVQSVKATFFRARQFFSCDCTRNNALDVDFFSYDSTLARSMRLLISTANIGAIAKKRDGKVDKLIAGGGGRRDSSLHMSSTLHSINTVAASETMNFSDLLQANLEKESLRIERIHATKVLCGLLDLLPLPRVQATSVSSAAALRNGTNTQSKQGATNIYDYIHDQVGHDYAFIMTFFVMLPQTLFDQPGEYLLNRTMGVFVEWQKNVTQLSLKASEDVLLEMRLRTVVQERRGHNSAAAQNNALRQSIDMGDNAALMATTASLAQTNRKAAGKKDPAAVFLDKLDTFHRRLFLAILACSPIMEGAVLKEKIKLCDEKDDAAAREPPPAATPAETASSSVLGAVRNAFELFIPSFRVTFPVALSPFRASKDLVLTHESFTKLCEHNSVLTTFLAKSHDDYTDYMNYKHPRGLKSGTSSPPSGSPLTAAQPANPNQADGAAAPSDATEVPKRRAQVAWANASYNEKDTHDAAATGQQKHSFQQLLTIEKLVNTLLIPETSNIRLEDFRIHVYEEFGEQALSFGLSIKDTQSIEWYLERRAERQQLKKVKQQQRDLGQPVVRGGHNNNALPQLVVQGSNDLVPQREVSEIDMPKSSANSMNVDEDSDALLVTLRGDEHLEDVAANDPASFYILEEREFDEAWKAAKRTSPPDEVKDRVFSVFPTTGDGKKYVDMRMFLKFCRESVHAHKNVSFSRHYCLAEEQRFHSVMWILFYIPLFVVTLFFLFYKNPLGDTIWISQGLSTSFAASSGATSLADIETWMASCAKSIFPLPNEPAATHNNANFYVGTMRFRQHRVDPDDCSQQYLDYFGDPDTTTLRFPEGISPSEKISYTSRVQRDYSGLFSNQECYGAYDFGASKSTQGYLRANNVQYPEVATAFTYQDTGVSNSIDAFDSHYSSGGFVFDVNYTVDGSYATSAVTNLINALWLDNATRVVVLEIIVLNTNVAVLARGRFGIELTGGGAYEPFSSVYVARTSYPTNGLFRLFQAIAILIILIYITVVMYTYVTHVRQHISMFGENYAVAAILGIFEDLGVPWDVAIIALMIASFTIRFYAAAGDSFDTIYNNGKWATDVENALEWAKTLKQVEGVNGFMVFVRFLYFIGLNERRLAIVLDTLRVSVVDLVSILALWIMALCACTLAAVICFGYGATEAFNFQSAFFDLYNSASGGNPNYYDYTAARRETAPVFWILYFVVTFFVLYNMVVAVLTSKFADVKAQTFGFETVNRVMMQEASEEWYSRFGEYKHRLWSGFVIQEARQVFLRIRYGWMVQGPPLRLRCENPRSCWTYMVKTWNTLDMGIPVDVVEAAIALMTLELTVAQENGRWEHIRDIVEKQRTLGKLGATIKFSTVAQGSGSHRPHVSPTSPVQEGETAPLGERGASNIIEEAAAASGAAPGPRIEHANRELITYADRRLPLWEEYIYYVFKGERDLVQRYLIGLPSHLLSWRLPKLWRHAVESEHYFTLLRSSYTVDLSESRVVQLTKILPNVDEIEASLLQSVTVDGTALQQQPSPARQRV